MRTEQIRRIRQSLEDVHLGYQIAPATERAALQATLSVVAVSVASAAFASGPGRSRSRPSHLRGSAAGVILVAAGMTALLNREDGQEVRSAVPMGVGAGLALDEVSSSAGLAAIAAATVSVAGLVRDLHRRGAVHRAIRQLAVV